jgi:hypothetical protein
LIFKDVALQYINAGLCAFPAIRSQKRPMGKWKEYQNRLPTTAEWEGWQFADAVCLVCGKISGNLLMIDFDQQGKALHDFREQIDSELYHRLVIEQSQSGGFHIIVRSTEPVCGNIVLAKDTDKKVLIETRGEGGIFLCAPTPGYVLLQGDFNSIPILSPAEVETLLHAAWSLDQCKQEEPKPTSTTEAPTCSPVERWQSTGKTPMEDYNERGRDDFKKLLEKHGWVYVSADTTNERWRRPGKNIGTSASLKTDEPVFYIHSSNCTLPNDKGYSLFYIYAHLEHGGDQKAAAKELASLGYGDPLSTAPASLPSFITDTSGDNKEEPVDETESRSCYDDDDCPEKFPEHLLNVPGLMGELSQFINDTSTARQPVFALAAAIAFQSLLCAHNIKDPTNIRTNPYILSVGRTASGKNRGRVVIREIMKRLKDMPAITDWYDPTHYVANRIASAEAIGTYLGVNNGILMWLWDEIGRALDTPEHKRPTNINAMITAMMILYTSAADEYDPNLRAETKNTKPAIEQPNFILYGTTTKEKMFEGFSASNLEDGLLGRLLIFEGNDDWEDIEQEDVQPVTQSLIDKAHWWFCQRANRINPVTPAPKTIEVTGEAKVLFRQLAETKKQIRKSKNLIKDALWGRVVEQARQLALAYAASADYENPIVDNNAAQWACELIVYLTKRKYYLANRHIAGSEFDKNQKAVLRFIEEQKGKCTKNMICRHFRRFKQWERNEILDNLLETEAIYIINEKQDGMRQKNALYIINNRKNKQKGKNDTNS